MTGSVLSSSDEIARQPGFAQHHARAPDRVGEDLVVARQRAQLGAGRLVEIAQGVGGDRSGLSRSGSENTTSKAIATAPRLVRLVIRSAIRVRGHGHWPRFGQALFVDIDDGDRPLPSCRADR